MCNLSQGIEEKGIAIGRAEGEAGLIIKMYKNGFTAEQIASATDKDIEEVKAIIAGKEPALVYNYMKTEAFEFNDLKAFVL